MRTLLAERCLKELKKEAIQAAHDGNVVCLHTIRERLKAVQASKNSDPENTVEMIIAAVQCLELNVKETEAREITKEIKKVA